MVQKTETRVICTHCRWEGDRDECRFGHNDFCCPKCGREAIQEKKLEAVKGLRANNTWLALFSARGCL